jgi:glucokinase
VGMNGTLITATQRILEPFTQPSHPKLIASSLGQDAQLIGAIRLALDLAKVQNAGNPKGLARKIPRSAH